MRKKLLTVILSAGTAALAAPLSFDLLGGGELDSRNQSYSYLGLVISKPVGGDSSALFRLWTDYLTYRFPQAGETVRAEAPAFHLAVGAGRSFGAWRFSLWSGWERRDTRVRPDLPGVEVKGVTDSLILQFEAYGGFGNGTDVSFITSYSSGTSYLWSRARVKRRISERGLSLGLEVLGHGNEDYRAFQSGPLIEVPVARLYLTLRGGLKNSSQGSGFYGGIELYSGF